MNEQQLQIRKNNRKRKGHTTKRGKHGMLVWYSGKLEELSIVEYSRAITKEYNRQRDCAIRGYVGRVNPCEHFFI